MSHPDDWGAEAPEQETEPEAEGAPESPEAAERAEAAPEAEEAEDAGAEESADAGAEAQDGEADEADEPEEDADDAPPAEIEEPDASEAARDEEDRLAAQARLLSDARVRTILESLLFVSDKPLNERAIQQVTGLTPSRIRAAMEELQGHYREGVAGLVLHEVGGGWQLRTCPTSARFVRRFLRVRPQRLTRAALETLSIVAYRQPVTRPEVEEIRGVDCGAVMKALLERGLVQVIGKKEEVGRPLLYGTTKAFLEFFNLKDLGSLPTLREFHELNEEHRQIVEDNYPGAEGEGEGGGILDGIDDAPPDAHRAEDEEAIDALDEALQTAERASRGVSDALDGRRPPAGGGAQEAERSATDDPQPEEDADARETVASEAAPTPEDAVDEDAALDEDDEDLDEDEDLDDDDDDFDEDDDDFDEDDDDDDFDEDDEDSDEDDEDDEEEDVA